MAKPQQQSLPSFESVLDEVVTDDKTWDAPIPLPRGTYGVIVSEFRSDKSSQKQTDFIEFTLNVISAFDDVVEEELKEAGGIEGRTIRDTYYITDNSKYRLKKFFDLCEVNSVGKSLSQNCQDCLNTELVVGIIHKPLPGGEGVRIEIKSRANPNADKKRR